MNKEYTEAQLYTQLRFLAYIFDFDKLPKELKIRYETTRRSYDSLKEEVEKMKKLNKFGYIDLSDIFRFEKN